MSSKGPTRWGDCTGKQHHETYKQARAHAVSHNHWYGGDSVFAYRCPGCGCWHVGHAPRQSTLDLLDHHHVAHLRSEGEQAK